MVFEDYSAQLVQLKVLDEVTTPLLNRGVEREQIETEARKLLDRVGLNDDNLEQKKIWELSGGQQQQLAIAATLAIEPKILILDEVVDKLDPEGRMKVRQAIDEPSEDKTLIIVSHDAEFLLETVDRILVIAEGTIVAEGSPHEILANRELLERADLEPTHSWQIAEGIGLESLPLTVDKLVQVLEDWRVPFPTEIPKRKVSEGQPLIEIKDVSFGYNIGLLLAGIAKTPWKWVAVVWLLQIPSFLVIIGIPLYKQLSAGSFEFDDDIISALRLILGWSSAIFVSLSLFSTMDADDLTNGLRGLKVPPVAAFAVGLSYRLLFVTLGEALRIADAMRLKGVDLETKNPLKWITNSLKLCLPVLFAVLRRGPTLMSTLEMRGFMKGSSVIRLGSLDLSDLILLLLGLGFLLWSICDRFNWLPGLPALLGLST